MNKNYYVYIITNKLRTVFYIGVTNNLERRLLEHESEIIPGFSQKYKLKHFVYFEEYSEVDDALRREKQLKNWHRDWKLNLIRRMNPKLKDLKLGAETSSA